MIKLDRERTAQAIPKAFRGPGRIDKLVILVEGKRQGNLKFDSDVWKAAKKQLKAETSGKCAYCEASTSVVAHGDVEHFRPKSKYWWLAYCYDNYLYSCQICNQQFKGDKFPFGGSTLTEPVLPDASIVQDALRTAVERFTPDPLNDAEGLAIADFLQALTDEEAHLPDPYVVDPEPFFKWEADRVQKRVSIAPRSNAVAVQKTFEAVRDFYGLNRDTLQSSRWAIYAPLETFRTVLLSGLLDAATEQVVVDMIKKMMGRDAEFAGMVRYFVRDEWGMQL